MRKKMAGFGVVIVMCLMISGCLVCSDTTKHEGGKKVKDSTVKQLEPGKTTKAWAMSVLGTPTSRNMLDNGIEVLKYEYTETVKGEFAIFLLLALDSEKTTKQSLYLEFQDDILTRYWSEHD